MSIEAVRAVLTRSKAKAGARLVLLALAERCNEDGTMWPSIPTLCSEAALSERMVRYALRNLTTLGEIEEAERGFGRGHTTKYRLCLLDEKRGNGLPQLKGATDCPVGKEKGQSTAEKGQSATLKGAMDCPRTVKEPSEEPPEISEAKASLSAAPAADPVQYDQVRELFHRLCPSLPKLRDMPEHRKNAIRCRWKNARGEALARFEELFRVAEASDFLSGRDGRWGSCSFDWLMNAKNAQKAIEGNYNNDRQRRPGFQSNGQSLSAAKPPVPINQRTYEETTL